MAFVAIVLATTPVLASPIEPGAIRVIDGDTIEGKYPPAEPGALGCEPLKAADRGR
jgi:hypothetical protein